jgi:hypothetical protein
MKRIGATLTLSLVVAVIQPALAVPTPSPGYVPLPPGATYIKTRSNGPTLATTTAWLESNLPPVFADFDGLDLATEYAQYHFIGCTMTVDVTMRLVSHLGDPSGNIVYAIRLAPSTGKEFYVSTVRQSGEENGPTLLEQQTTFSFRDVQPSIDLSKHIVGEPHDDFLIISGLNVAPRQVAFTTSDANMAARLQKALTHVASLCGAKAEPF